MFVRLYGVVDRKACVIAGTLMLFPNDGSAVRTIGDAVNDPQTLLGQHPEDFVLKCFGTLELFPDRFPEFACVGAGEDVVECSFLVSKAKHDRDVLDPVVSSPSGA